VNTNPKLRHQKGVGVEFSCLKCRKTLKLRNLKLKKNYPLLTLGFGWEKEKNYNAQKSKIKKH
jgi:hypothetical protein